MNKATTNSNTTEAAVKTAMGADRVCADLSTMAVGESVIVSGTRDLIGGGSRITQYTITRENDNHGHRFTYTRETVEAA